VITFVVWALLSLLLAVVVFLVANVMERREVRDDQVPGGLGQFWRDFRSGLRRRERGERLPRTARPVDTDMDEFFAATIESAPGYVDADELSGVLQRARDQARTSLHVGTVSKPH